MTSAQRSIDVLDSLGRHNLFRYVVKAHKAWRLMLVWLQCQHISGKVLAGTEILGGGGRGKRYFCIHCHHQVETSSEWREHFPQFQDTTVPLLHPSSCMLNHKPSQQSCKKKKKKSHGNEVISQDTTYLIWRPCFQWRRPCQDPAGNRTTWRPLDHRKETQTAMVRSCLPFIRSGQKHLARHSERGKEGKADRRRDWKTTSGNGQAWSSPSPRRRWKTEKNWIRGGPGDGCKVICSAPTTLAVEG